MANKVIKDLAELADNVDSTIESTIESTTNGGEATSRTPHNVVIRTPEVNAARDAVTTAEGVVKELDDKIAVAKDLLERLPLYTAMQEAQVGLAKAKLALELAEFDYVRQGLLTALQGVVIPPHSLSRLTFDDSGDVPTIHVEFGLTADDRTALIEDVRRALVNAHTKVQRIDLTIADGKPILRMGSETVFGARRTTKTPSGEVDIASLQCNTYAVHKVSGERKSVKDLWLPMMGDVGLVGTAKAGAWDTLLSAIHKKGKLVEWSIVK